tara:strand:+ start:138 stop:611 length:474 start_codon:yes stop_codon:yes gene_type:complete
VYTTACTVIEPLDNPRSSAGIYSIVNNETLKRLELIKLLWGKWLNDTSGNRKEITNITIAGIQAYFDTLCQEYDTNAQFKKVVSDCSQVQFNSTDVTIFQLYEYLLNGQSGSLMPSQDTYKQNLKTLITSSTDDTVGIIQTILQQSFLANLYLISQV